MDFCYSYDGGSHDAHQHRELIDIVDNGVFNRYLRIFLEYSDIPPAYHPVILDVMTQLDVKFFTLTGLRGTIKGTVFSGHPTRTTLFNTFRVYMYNLYAREQSQNE